LTAGKPGNADEIAGHEIVRIRRWQMGFLSERRET
jgi:hypothetical protein